MSESESVRNITGKERDAGQADFERAMVAYFDVWNMDCQDCARLLREGLAVTRGVLLVNVFYKQGVAVVIYNPDDVTTIELGRAIEQIGADSARFYGAEIIGQGSAQNVLRL
jgi:hypothetical protein